MEDREAFSEFICPFMSSWQGIKHCSYHCRFYNSEERLCIICAYMESMIANKSTD